MAVVACCVPLGAAGVPLGAAAVVGTDGFGVDALLAVDGRVATALATCIATTMGIFAKRHDIDLRGMRVSVKKEMVSQPFRLHVGSHIALDVMLGRRDRRKAVTLISP